VVEILIKTVFQFVVEAGAELVIEFFELKSVVQIAISVSGLMLMAHGAIGAWLGWQ
jgi:hypothetical protein